MTVPTVLPAKLLGEDADSGTDVKPDAVGRVIVVTAGAGLPFYGCLGLGSGRTGIEEGAAWAASLVGARWDRNGLPGGASVVLDFSHILEPNGDNGWSAVSVLIEAVCQLNRIEHRYPPVVLVHRVVVAEATHLSRATPDQTPVIQDRLGRARIGRPEAFLRLKPACPSQGSYEPQRERPTGGRTVHKERLASVILHPDRVGPPEPAT